MDYAAGWQKLVVVALALTACGFDSGGVGDGSTGDTSTGTTDPSMTDPSTDPATTSPTDPATTDPATTDPATTDPATTDPATTDPATTDPSTDPTTTDPTDPTTTDQSETDATDDSETASGSTGEPDDAYGPCEGNVCPDEQMCSVVVDENEFVLGNSCRESCNSVNDCPIPETGNPEVLCPSDNNYPWCVLGCEMGPCPDGMTCFQTQYGGLCYWDV